MRILISFFVVLLIISCAQTKYTHPDKDANQFEHAKYECEKIAKHQAKEAGASDNPFVIADKTDQCLQSSGWTPVK